VVGGGLSLGSLASGHAPWLNRPSMKQETAKEITAAVLGTLIGGAIGFVASPFLREMWAFCADTVLPRLSPQARLSLVATLATLSLVLGILLYSASSKRLLIRRYRHVQDRGFWVDRKSGKTRVCGNCLIDGIVSPLTAYSYSGHTIQNRWTCDRKDCGRTYPADKDDFKSDAQQ